MQKQDLAFSNRFVPDALRACNHSDFSVVWLPVNNSQWRTLRKIMNSHIFSGNKLDTNEHLRTKKIQDLIDYCHNSSKFGEAVDIGRATFMTSLNLISNTIFSKDLTDPFSDSAKEFKELVWNIMVEEIFAAGTDTISNTLEWAMAELLKNPHTLEKAQQELAQVIGRGKLIDEADVAKLPYLRCIIKETFRIHPQVPFLVPRKAEEHVELYGYIIPKDSQVLVNVWAIGRDPSLWENPLDFNPGRFWESEIDVRGRDFELIPFGAGRRICPGLPLAIRMVPVALGSLINTFNWKQHGGIAPKDLDMEESFGITLAKTQPLLAFPIPL